MKIVTWNVNSVRVRERRLVEWLERHTPDVVCLQELKVEESEFPFVPLRAIGYRALVHGQRTYNGVAILSREEPEDARIGLAGDDQARLLSARLQGVQVICGYFPNG